MSETVDIPGDVYFCPKCVRPFTEVGELLEHLKEEHPDHEVTDEERKSVIEHGKRE